MARSEYIYRILRFEHLVSMFQTKTLHLASPGSWEDPYELKLDDAVFSSVYAQCWSLTPVSDAMWRIYSPSHTSVRVRTTANMLRDEVARGIRTGWNYKVEPVTYLSTQNLNHSIRRTADSLRMEFDPLAALDTLFLKRDAFSHEAEVRLVVYAPGQTGADTSIAIPCAPHDLIQDVMVDPRASAELYDVFQYYLRAKLKFRGRVRQSALYSPVQAFAVRGTDA